MRCSDSIRDLFWTKVTTRSLSLLPTLLRIDFKDSLSSKSIIHEARNEFRSYPNFSRSLSESLFKAYNMAISPFFKSRPFSFSVSSTCWANIPCCFYFVACDRDFSIRLIVSLIFAFLVALSFLEKSMFLIWRGSALALRSILINSVRSIYPLSVSTDALQMAVSCFHNADYCSLKLLSIFGPGFSWFFECTSFAIFARRPWSRM